MAPSLFIDQWDEWLALMKKHGIIVHLEFYNDATDIEKMGWTLDSDGNLHANEQRFIEGVMKRFKHRKNNAFMERTDFHTMQPRDDLAAGSTKWVLAKPGSSYIAYTHDYAGSMGIKEMETGTYDLLWFDTTNGKSIRQVGVAVTSGDATWSKPDSIGGEPALYVKRQ